MALDRPFVPEPNGNSSDCVSRREWSPLGRNGRLRAGYPSVTEQELQFVPRWSETGWWGFFLIARRRPGGIEIRQTAHRPRQRGELRAFATRHFNCRG